jgi:hypothetical protein
MWRRVWHGVAAATIAATGGMVVPTRSASAEDMPIFVDLDKPTPGPRGAVAIVGDSVMLGSAYETNGWGPSVAQMLVDRGWGPIRLKAGAGFQTGRLNSSNQGADMSRWLRTQRASGFDPHVIMVSLGPNEILFCNHSTTCAEQSIDYFMDVAGEDHQVWWTLITMTDPRDQSAWNDALVRVAARRTNLTLWDWPTIQQQTGIPLAGDHIHLPGAPAYRSRSALMADDFTAQLGVAERVDQQPPAAFSGGDPLTYRPVPPKRQLDTRETGQRLPAGGTLTVDLGALAPDTVTPDVEAVAVNVAAVDPAAEGFLTVYPCSSDRPVAASVNFPARQPRSAQVMALLSPSRTLCVYANVAADVVIDLQGVFVASGGTKFSPATPTRLLDTRRTGRSQILTVAAPSGATAVAVTITVANGATAGFLAAFPCGGSVPVVANVHWGPMEIVAGAAFVPVAADGTFCVYTNASVDVVVDLTGTFAESNALRFVASAPARRLDTRLQWNGPIGMGQTIDVQSAPADAVAVTGTIVIIQPAVDGYLTGTLCGVPPGQTSSVSAARNGIVANALTVGVSANGTLCVSAYAAAHAVFDTTGWWVP